MAWDYEKPSRQKRRQKRSWKRPPKKSLDRRPTPWQSWSTVLETPLLAVAAPDRHSGFFTSIGSPMAGSGQLYNTSRGKAASGLVAVSKYLPPIFWEDFSINLLGGHHG